MRKNLTRRNLLRALSLLPLAGRIHGQKTSPTNLIFILADDLGYGEISCHGQKQYRTPRIDTLATEGMRFTDHYAGAAVCAPSRSCLMTGRHTGHARIRDNFTALQTRAFLRSSDTTVAEILKQAGYATGAIGKWGLGDQQSPGHPNAKGFDYWYGFLDQREAHNHYPASLWRNREKVNILENQQSQAVPSSRSNPHYIFADGDTVDLSLLPAASSQGVYANDLFTAEAIEFIGRNRQNKFFLYLAYTLPHAELKVPEDSRQETAGKVSGGKEMELPGGGKSTANEVFAAMVTRLDRDIGRVLDHLKELDLDQNTVVIFSSDNGAHSSGGKDTQALSGSGPLRGGKHDLYEGGVRVPFLVRWPGKVTAGAVTSHVSSFWDFFPTAAELAGISVPPGLDGISFLPAMLGHRQRAHEFLYWEYRRNKGTQAVRFGEWKAVRQGKGTPLELYNLKDDIGERNDIAAKNPDMVRRAEKYLSISHTESGEFPLYDEVEKNRQ